MKMEQLQVGDQERGYHWGKGGIDSAKGSRKQQRWIRQNKSLKMSSSGKISKDWGGGGDAGIFQSGIMTQIINILDPLNI